MQNLPHRRDITSKDVKTTLKGVANLFLLSNCMFFILTVSHKTSFSKKNCNFIRNSYITLKGVSNLTFFC